MSTSAQRVREIAQVNTKLHGRITELERELAEARTEIDRLKANVGCAREQKSTQFCAEAVQAQRELAEAKRDKNAKNAVLERVKLWLAGDKWRFSENPQERTEWTKINAEIEAAIEDKLESAARAEGGAK